MALPLNHQTAAQFAERFWTRLRDAYRRGDKLRYHYMVWRIWKWIQDGDLTSDQVRLSFNSFFGTSYNPSQWSNFVTNRFVPIKDRYLAMLAETELA